MVGLFVIGAGVSAAGLYGISKKKYPYFFLSVAGCGAGILYLSILLSYWYFSVVGKWAMYGMLLLWAVFVLWMSRKSVPLFRLIGQCGIVLSLLFAFRQLNALETGLIFFFFVLVSALYQFADHRIGIACQLSTLLCNAISLLILTVLFTVTLRRAMHTPMFGLLLAEGMLLILYTLAQLIWYRMRMRPAERSGMGYFFTALSGLLLVQLQAQWFFFFWDTGKYLLSALTAVAVWTQAETRYVSAKKAMALAAEAAQGFAILAREKEPDAAELQAEAEQLLRELADPKPRNTAYNIDSLQLD